MMPIGYSDLKKVISLPGTWDLDYLRKWETVDGISWTALVQRLGAGLVLFNRDLRGGYWSNFIRTTSELAIRFSVGGSGELPQVSEYGRPDPIYGEEAGTMLPLKDFGGTLGWTYMALRRARSGKLEGDVRELIRRSTNTWEKQIVTRLFKMEADTVGSTGKSVPFADGGTVDAEYVPPSYDGQDFDNTHDHFARYTLDAAGRKSALQFLGSTLKEHGIAPPWDLIVADADKTTWSAMTDPQFVKPERGALSTLGVEIRGQVSEETYVGIFETEDGWFRVRTSARLPTAYAGAFKPLGFGAMDNPLAVRTEEGFDLGLMLVGQIDQFPLQEAIAYFTFGAGVGNRLAGAACYFAAAGDYVTPTIS